MKQDCLDEEGKVWKKQMGVPYFSLFLCCNLGETCYAKQDYDNAAGEFQKVLETTEDETLLRRCYNSLAETYQNPLITRFP